MITFRVTVSSRAERLTERRITLSQNKMIKPLREHDKNRAAGVYFQIRNRIFDGALGAAEDENDFSCKIKRA